MTDRELLELAARAAGFNELVPYRQEWMENGDWWNPLTDDGDALRLATTLKLSIDIGDTHTSVISNDKKVCVIDKSTRRAITRAAAEIGKAMK